MIVAADALTVKGAIDIALVVTYGSIVVINILKMWSSVNLIHALTVVLISNPTYTIPNTEAGDVSNQHSHLLKI